MSMPTWPNLVTMFFDQAEHYGAQPFLWQKRDGAYKPWSWDKVEAQVTSLAKGLLALGLNNGDRVILVGENRPEWMVADLAIMAAGGITTPAYTTNTADDQRHILQDSGAKGAIVSTARLAERVIKAAKGLDGFEFVIVMDDASTLKASSLKVMSLKQATADGKSRDDDIKARAAELNRSDTACIIYTSGTGGTPKGVMLHHGAILHNCEGALDALSELGIGREVFLSFLPLSHAYEHTAGQFFPIAIGAEVYYAEGVETLSTNMLEAHPTIMTAVPRLYEVLHQRITAGVIKAGGLKQKMFMRTMELGRKRYDGDKLSLFERLQDFILDKLVRDKVRARFGGALKALVSGGAPLNPEIGMFFTSLGLRILQGYGQTESAPLISVNRPSWPRLHSVGPPVINTTVKFAEDGEILVQGELVMQGYWNNDEATRATIKDGWLHTGDIGQLDENGHLVITDRKKDIIVNSGGDNVAPQRVEGVIVAEPELSQAMVYGDKRPHLVAVVVPDDGWLTDWKRANGKQGDLAALATDKDLHTALAPALGRINKKLNNIEKVRRFVVADDAFTIENEQMTPTMKVRRHVVRAIYGERLEALYK